MFPDHRSGCQDLATYTRRSIFAINNRLLLSQIWEKIVRLYILYKHKDPCQHMSTSTDNKNRDNVGILLIYFTDWERIKQFKK